MAGLSRRALRPTGIAHGRGVQALNVLISWGAWAWGLAQLFFIVNFFLSLRRAPGCGEPLARHHAGGGLRRPRPDTATSSPSRLVYREPVRVQRAGQVQRLLAAVHFFRFFRAEADMSETVIPYHGEAAPR